MPYLAELELPQDVTALEVGCGTGAVTRILASLPCIEKVVGIDPSSIFIERARSLAGGLSRLSFEIGDARTLAFADSSFDLVVFHTPCAICQIRSRRSARRIASSALAVD
jgi:ubiquinone/menaquinone biosynthesis C-methylase UbiE